MHLQPSRNMSRSSFSSTQAAGRVNPARFPEAQFLTGMQGLPFLT